MSQFLASNTGYVVNPSDTASCEYCPYETGADYAKGFNINAEYYGWRDVSATIVFNFDIYVLCFA